MPIYEYFCLDCEFKFELLRSASQSTEKAACPRCQKSVERVLSSFACFTKNDSGVTSAVGGSSCGSCSIGNCANCGM